MPNAKRRVRTQLQPTFPLLELPAELLRMIVVWLVRPDDSHRTDFECDLRLLLPDFPVERTWSLLLEAMHSHGATLGGVERASAFACVCKLTQILVPEAARQAALDAGPLTCDDEARWPRETIPVLNGIISGPEKADIAQALAMGSEQLMKPVNKAG